MSATVAPAPRPAVRPAAPPGERGARDRRLREEGRVVALLAAGLAALVALTWRKWGVPEIDAGAELTAADRVARGALAYRDVRYFYGPLGLYALAAGFRVFGAGFTTAFAFGLVQTTAILAAFYALARQWLEPVMAGLATAVLLALAFSGTAFDYVLPHTNSATVGLLCLLAMLLMLTRERPLGAGVAAGLVGLTRPEFAAVAAGSVGAYLLATARVHGRAELWRRAWRIAAPAIVIPAAVLGWFSAQAGASVVFTEDIWPVDFLRTAGYRAQAGWAPFDLSSLFGLLARGTCYAGLLAALVGSVEGWRAAHGARRLLALWPLALAAAALVAADRLLALTGLLGAQRAALESEVGHLTIAMSWLPALGIALAAWSLLGLLRGGTAPLGRSWPADLALVAAAAGLGLRAYNAFNPTGSYAVYYAGPLVLVSAIMHARLAERRPGARAGVVLALALAAAGLSAYALGALYRHDTSAVSTPRGTFLTTSASAGPLAATVRAVDTAARPGQPILAGPADGGIYFMADRPPALADLMLLPGLLDDRVDELAAIATMRRRQVSLAVVGARDFSVWRTPTFGADYAPVLGAHLRAAAVSTQTFGVLGHPVGGTTPSQGFQVIRLATCAGGAGVGDADCPRPSAAVTAPASPHGGATR